MLGERSINALFERVAERQYTKDLLFSDLVGLMGDVVLQVEPSVHAAYQSRRETLKISTTALYNKLNRVEIGVSAELVHESARRATPVIEALKAPFKPWLRGYRSRILDGNHLSATEHRLQELRTIWDGPLPGQALAVLDQELMCVTKVVLTEDGHAQERSLLDQVLALVERKDLWIADRNFCTCKFLCGIAKRLGYFLIRQHGSLKGELVGERKYIGRTSSGSVYEQSLIITDPATGKRWRFRRITVELLEATRDGDCELHLLSNLPAKIKATRLSDLYRKRWTIETAFQEVTETLACEINTLGYPPAALFAFCLALLAYNAVSVLKAALRAVHGEEKVTKELSAYYLTLEISKTYDGMMVAIPAPHWQIFQDLTPSAFASTLKTIAKHVDLARYQKHPRGPKKTPPKRMAYKKGGHVSTARLLQERNKAC
jgi:IS4 transposase